jgi:sugar phosphate isomerase/epimerase
MGEGDEDVIGAVVDTGWFGTQRYDAAEAIAALKGRLFHIHLKDVKERRKEPTGFQLIDMGHETCRLGAGIVPVERCVKTAIRDGYTGPISIEHEPEDYDPSEDARASLLLLKSMLS